MRRDCRCHAATHELTDCVALLVVVDTDDREYAIAARDMFRENLTRELPDNDDRDDRGQTEDETQKDSQEREMKFARSRRSEE